jgi:endonuclease-3
MKGLLTKAEVALVTAILEEVYPAADCELDFKTTFQLLVAVVLSAQTTDKMVNRVTEELFALYPDLTAMLTADEATLQGIIKRIGMYKTKTKNLMALCLMLKTDFNGEVPSTLEDLTKLPGVGRKTANVVLSNAFNQPAIAVDTHVFRLANRIGITAEKDVYKTELALMAKLPKDKWSIMHHRLIWHGRRQCFARKPLCETCQIKSICRAYPVD